MQSEYSIVQWSVAPLTHLNSVCSSTHPSGKARGRIWSFFFGQKVSLAQDITGSFISTIFSGLLVAGVAAFMLHLVDDYVALSQKRRAVETMRNEAISQTVNEVTEAYSKAECAHNYNVATTPECKTQLENLIFLLRSRRALLSSLGFDQVSSSFETLIASARNLRSFNDIGAAATRGRELQEALNSQFLAMISTVSAEYR